MKGKERGKLSRQMRLLDLLAEKTFLQMNELALDFGVSTMTLRRDLLELEQEGKLIRIPGGARIQTVQDDEKTYVARSKAFAEEKYWIGRKAAAMIKDDDLIAIDVGSTMMQLVKNLDDRKKIMVVTHWTPIIPYLHKKANIKTVILGGCLYYKELSLVGKMTLEMLNNFQPSKVFLGISGISAEHGIISDFNLEEVEVKTELIRRGHEIIVLADHSKIGKIGPVRIGQLSEVDVLITDRNADAGEIERLRDLGLRVVLAGPE